jgi:maltooligosyltrehalose synthase
MFDDLLLGRVTMPVPPRQAVREVSADRNLPKTWGDGVKAEKMAKYLEKRREVAKDQRENILQVMADGAESLKAIAQEAGVVQSRAHAVLHELLADSYVEKREPSPRRFTWHRTEKTLPHAYSTGSSLYGQVDTDSKDPVGKTVFCGEVAA